MLKAYKYRIYPNKAQEELLGKTFGCCGMDSAYQKFFREHVGYPKFRSKHDGHKLYTTNFTSGKYYVSVLVDTEHVPLPEKREM